MNLNNSVIVNECITKLQTIDDLNSDIAKLKAFLKTSKLLEEEKKDLQSILNIMAIKNTQQKNTIHKVANDLNKTGMY